jgi:hypothetical protein
LLNQTGTNAPTATVLENTLGGTIVWSYSALGLYIGTLNSTFTTNKTMFRITPSMAGEFAVTWIDADSFAITPFDSSGSAINDALLNTPFEIEIYP